MSGEDYSSHCLEVARTLDKWKLDKPSIIAALLQDIGESKNYKQEDIVNMFGEEVAFLVERLNKLKAFTYTGESKQAENSRKLLIALSQDLRVIFIKLADKLQDMQTLQVLPPQEQERIAEKATNLYAPLAYQLGMHKLSGDFEDLAFPHLYPQKYKWLLNTVREQYDERQNYMNRVKPRIKAMLKKEGIAFVRIDARAKRYASLYKKLQRYDMDLGKVHDLVALRVIVENVEDCYGVLGAVHKYWEPLSGRIKDFIVQPKSNGYRSLHTTVNCIDDRVVEIQIRTKEMHEEAELGAAAHWAYQQTKGTKDYFRKRPTRVDERELLWVRQLSNWQERFKKYEDFVQSLKAGFFTDQIFVLTPKHDVVDLPIDATPVDFAYQIHSDVGDECVGAKVNGVIVPLHQPLYSGDIVEIMRQKRKKPSESWLEFVKTSVARDRIKSARRAKLRLFKGSK